MVSLTALILRPPLGKTISKKRSMVLQVKFHSNNKRVSQNKTIVIMCLNDQIIDLLSYHYIQHYFVPLSGLTILVAGRVWALAPISQKTKQFKSIVNFFVLFFRFCEIGVRGLKSSSHPEVATKTCQYHNVLSIFRYSIWANSCTIWFHWTVTSFPLLSHGYFYMMYWIIHDICSNS